MKTSEHFCERDEVLENFYSSTVVCTGAVFYNNEYFSERHPWNVMVGISNYYLLILGLNFEWINNNLVHFSVI